MKGDSSQPTICADCNCAFTQKDPGNFVEFRCGDCQVKWRTKNAQNRHDGKGHWGFCAYWGWRFWSSR